MKRTKVISKTITVASGTAAGTSSIEIVTDSDYGMVEALCLNEITNGKASGDLPYKLSLVNTSKNETHFEDVPKEQLLSSFEGNPPVNIKPEDRWLRDYAGMIAKGDTYTLYVKTSATTDEDLKLSISFRQVKEIN